jgi:hypothetical protein
MTRLSLIRLYRTEDVPDHILQEVNDLIKKMVAALEKATEGHDTNIVLSAFNRLHAMAITEAITEKGLSEAARTEAIGLIKNIEHLSGKKIIN